MAKYQTIFFDLDHTLWDFETNSREVLSELFEFFELSQLDISLSEFIEVYEEENLKLWDQYTMGKIQKPVLRVLRWRRTFLQFGVQNPALHKAFGNEYMVRCPKRTNLMPGVPELLEELKGEVPMAIITNGFTEVQGIKISNSGLENYFDAVITSDMAGVKKPNVRIFEVALKKMDAQAATSLMVGDNQLADTMGALNAGLDAVHLDVHDAFLGKPATHRIQSMEELLPILRA